MCYIRELLAFQVHDFPHTYSTCNTAHWSVSSSIAYSCLDTYPLIKLLRYMHTLLSITLLFFSDHSRAVRLHLPGEGEGDQSEDDWGLQLLAQDPRQQEGRDTGHHTDATQRQSHVSHVTMPVSCESCDNASLMWVMWQCQSCVSHVTMPVSCESCDNASLVTMPVLCESCDNASLMWVMWQCQSHVSHVTMPVSCESCDLLIWEANITVRQEITCCLLVSRFSWGRESGPGNLCSCILNQSCQK